MHDVSWVRGMICFFRTSHVAHKYGVQSMKLNCWFRTRTLCNVLYCTRTVQCTVVQYIQTYEFETNNLISFDSFENRLSNVFYCIYRYFSVYTYLFFSRSKGVLACFPVAWFVFNGKKLIKSNTLNKLNNCIN